MVRMFLSPWQMKLTPSERAALLKYTTTPRMWSYSRDAADWEEVGTPGDYVFLRDEVNKVGSVHGT